MYCNITKKAKKMILTLLANNWCISLTTNITCLGNSFPCFHNVPNSPPDRFPIWHCSLFSLEPRLSFVFFFGFVTPFKNSKKSCIVDEFSSDDGLISIMNKKRFNFTYLIYSNNNKVIEVVLLKSFKKVMHSWENKKRLENIMRCQNIAILEESFLKVL